MSAKAKRSEHHDDTPEFRQRLQEAADRHGVTLTAIGYASVGVQGDAGVVGPTAIIDFPSGTSIEEAGRIVTQLINEVPGLTRGMTEISTVSLQKAEQASEGGS